MKSALSTYIGLQEVDKATFQGLVEVLWENRWAKFFFSESSFISILRASRS